MAGNITSGTYAITVPITIYVFKTLEQSVSAVRQHMSAEVHAAAADGVVMVRSLSNTKVASKTITAIKEGGANG